MPYIYARYTGAGLGNASASAAEPSRLRLDNLLRRGWQGCQWGGTIENSVPPAFALTAFPRLESQEQHKRAKYRNSAQAQHQRNNSAYEAQHHHEPSAHHRQKCEFSDVVDVLGEYLFFELCEADGFVGEQVDEAVHF